MTKRTLPNDFNYKKEILDSYETYVRDILAMPIEQWVKFNYRVHSADKVSVLFAQKIIPEELQQTFLEIGRRHKEVLLSLGYAKISLLETQQNIQADRFKCTKSAKEFYFHLGTILDSLARITFLINYADAPTKRNLQGKLIRHFIDFSIFRNDYNLTGYRKLFNQKTIKEIEVLKNNFQQNEPSPFIFADKGKELLFPVSLRNASKPWSVELYNARFRKYVSLSKMLEEDFNVIQNFQSALYEKLFQEVDKFEKVHKLIIR